MSPRPAFEVLKEIQEFSPTHGDWRPLDTLLDELWALGVSAGALRILFGVFERFPEDDGAGVLWSIVHGVESLDIDYDATLRESLQRRSSLMGTIMLERLLRTSAR